MIFSVVTPAGGGGRSLEVVDQFEQALTVAFSRLTALFYERWIGEVAPQRVHIVVRGAGAIGGGGTG